MVAGIIVGTYSSIYIAPPFLVVWQEWLGERAKTKAAAEPTKVVAKKVRARKV
jgi:preprotein translocase subunit SecF